MGSFPLFSVQTEATLLTVNHGGEVGNGGGGEGHGCCFCNGLISSKSQANYPLLQLWWILLVTVRELLIKSLLSGDELLAYALIFYFFHGSTTGCKCTINAVI